MTIPDEILYNLIIAYKKNQISDIKGLDPLKICVYHIMQKFNCYLKYEDKRDIFSSFLCEVWKSKKNPNFEWVNRYIRLKVIDAMRKEGYIRDERMRINQQIQPSFSLHNIPDILKSTPFIAKDCFLW